MLADKKAFDRVEDALIDLGKIKAFEEENGKITGHMMILPVDIPEDIEVKQIPGKTPQGFEATFDFYDVAIGLAIRKAFLWTKALTKTLTNSWRMKYFPDLLCMSGM